MQESALTVVKPLILLVDDEPLVRAGTALMLEELDHPVLQAASALQGLQMLEADGTIEMLISDFRMPDMDGQEFILQARVIRPQIKALLMTGYNVDDDCFAGVDIPKLAKPFGIEALEEALKLFC